MIILTIFGWAIIVAALIVGARKKHTLAMWLCIIASVIFIVSIVIHALEVAR